MLHLKEAPNITLGTFMPFFYQDATYQKQKTGRTYYVAPEFSDNDTFELFYADLEAWFYQLLELLEAIIEGDPNARKGSGNKSSDATNSTGEKNFGAVSFL